MKDKIYKVFISYSWTNDTHIEKVMHLAQRLVYEGIDVVLDKWDLEEGQDKYAFMERCVTDSTVDRVLLICDKKYAEKANERKGGVGNETEIISSEVYDKSTPDKFLPVIFEKDENGKPYMPTYCKRLLYFDLSDEEVYEDGYEKLIRRIYEKPLYKKPKLGKRPDWLEEDDINLFVLKDIVKRLVIVNDVSQRQYLLNSFKNKYCEIAREYITEEINGEIIIATIDKMKALRDVYIDFLCETVYFDLDMGEYVAELFQQFYNEVFEYDYNDKSGVICEPEYFSFHLWELIICTVAVYYHYEKFVHINTLLSYTYFLRRSWYSDVIDNQNITCFRRYFSTIEEYKKQKENIQKISFSAEILVSREKKPLINKETLSFADILIYQVTSDLNIVANEHFGWYPASFIYNKNAISEYNKIKSKRFCEKFKKIYGVNTIKEMIEFIKNSNIKPINNIGWGCPLLSKAVSISDIASLN